jgi:hypothetical protein
MKTTSDKAESLSISIGTIPFCLSANEVKLCVAINFNASNVKYDIRYFARHKRL